MIGPFSTLCLFLPPLPLLHSAPSLISDPELLSALPSTWSTPPLILLLSLF